jgi:hypothetical protein
MSRAATSRLKVNPPVGSLPVLQYCAPDQLQIDEAYQRTLDAAPSQTLIRRIATFWDWGLCQPLVVARRSDGGLYVVDGQHRLAAAKLRGDIWQLPCVVASYQDAAEEAAAFVAINQSRRPLSRMQIFKAALAAGDEEAQKIQAALDENGLWIGTSPDLSVQKPGALTCLRGLEDCLRSYGIDTLAAALDVLAQSFKGEVLRYSGTIFPGIAAIVAAELKADSSFSDGERFVLMTEMVGGASQAEWYRDIGARTAEIPTRRAAAAAVLQDAWKECTEALLDEAA